VAPAKKKLKVLFSAAVLAGKYKYYNRKLNKKKTVLVWCQKPSWRIIIIRLANNVMKM
jgi:hypothetical protein